MSDVQNMGMYRGEMLDGQPHGNGTIGTQTILYEKATLAAIILYEKTR